MSDTVTHFAHLPRDTQARISSEACGRFALPSARTAQVLIPRYDIQCETVGETGLARPPPAAVGVCTAGGHHIGVLQDWTRRFTAAFDAERIASVPRGLRGLLSTALTSVCGIGASRSVLRGVG